MAINIEPTIVVIHTGYEFRLKSRDRWNKLKHYFDEEYESEDLKCIGLRLNTGETINEYKDVDVDDCDSGDEGDCDDKIYGVVFKISSFVYFTHIYRAYHDYQSMICYSANHGFDSMTYDDQKKEMIVKFDSESG